jgi:hypothetical protein
LGARRQRATMARADRRNRPAPHLALAVTDEGKCEVRTQIHLTDGYFEAPVDYCKAKTLVVQQGTLIWK